MRKLLALLALCLLICPPSVLGQDELREVVATVRGDTITVAYFQIRARLERWLLVNRLNSGVQFYRDQGYCGEEISRSLAGLSPFSTYIVELQDSNQLGLSVVNQAIDEQILRQEARIRNIEVSPEEVQIELERFLGLPEADDNATLTPSQIDHNQEAINSLLDDLFQNAVVPERAFREYMGTLVLRFKFQGIIGKDLSLEEQAVALNDWLQDLETRAGDKIKIFDTWQDSVPTYPDMIWPPVDPIEAIPIPRPANVLAYTDKINFDKLYHHPSGVFSVGVPSGWTVGEPVTDPKTGGADVSFLNETERSIVQITVQHTDDAITTLDALSAFFSPEKLAASWVNYRCALEVSRQEEGDKLILDFRLHSQTKPFIARQISWANGRWNSSIRVVTQADRADLLEYLLDNLLDTFEFTGLT